MRFDVERFLKSKGPGRSSVREFFNALCRDIGVEPTIPNEAACERELIARNLVTDGFVPVAIHGRAWPPKPPRKSSSRFCIGQLDLA